MKERFWAVLSAERPTYLLGLLRVAIGVFVLLGSASQLRWVVEHGYFADSFYIPLVPEWAVPSRNVYLALLGVRSLAALIAIAGVLARPALLLAALIGLYCLCCDRLEYHNNRYVLELLTFLLAFTPCDRSLYCFGASAKDARGPYWASWLMKVQVSLVYAASAGSKLVDVDWRGGQVLHVRYLHVLDLAAARGQQLPGWVHAALSSPAFAEVSSKAAIFGELFLALGLWLPRTRAFALWLGVMLHFGIQIAAHVEIFSFLMGAAYLLFAAPELAERQLCFDPSSARQARIARLCAALDWLRRFQLVPRQGPLEVVDRGGTVQRGWAAAVGLSRALPLLFPFWLPLAVVRHIRN